MLNMETNNMIFTKIVLLIAFIWYNPFNFADWVINLAWVALVVDFIILLADMIQKD